jgi:TonB family protein
LTKIKDIVFWIALLASTVYAAERPRQIVYSEDPQYPEIAKKMALHGTVKLRIWIKPDGSVRRVEYIGGHPLLTESALRAVKNWRYTPANQESDMIVEIKF